MATFEHNGVLNFVDESGNLHKLNFTGGNEGFGVLPSGTDLKTLHGKNGWYMLREDYTYTNAPAAAAGAWVVVDVKDKSAVAIVLNGPICFCNNLDVTTPAWRTLYDTQNKPKPREIGALEAESHFGGLTLGDDGEVFLMIDGLNYMLPIDISRYEVANKKEVFPIGDMRSGSANSLTNGVWRVWGAVTDKATDAAAIIYHRTWDDNFKAQLSIDNAGLWHTRTMLNGSAWGAWQQLHNDSTAPAVVAAATLV